MSSVFYPNNLLFLIVHFYIKGSSLSEILNM